MRLLVLVFGVVALLAVGLAFGPRILVATFIYLSAAFLLGVGNGAVFKLVPQFFPTTTASVTGLVGAMGGLGGFFPPLVLGFFRDRLGSVWPGFGLLALTAAMMWVNRARRYVNAVSSAPMS